MSQILSLRMIPLLTSAPFLLAAKLSSQRFNGLLAWLKICRRDKDKTLIFWDRIDQGQSPLFPAATVLDGQDLYMTHKHRANQFQLNFKPQIPVSVGVTTMNSANFTADVFFLEKITIT